MTAITLKKALKVRKELESLVAKPHLSTTVSLSVFSGTDADPRGPVEAGVAALRQQLDKHATLSRILSELRVAIASANVDAGIEMFLAQQAHIDRQMAALKLVVDAGTTPPDQDIKGELTVALKNLSADERPRLYGAGAPKAVAVSVVTEAAKADAQARIAELRREKEALEDGRTAANAARRVEIAEADAELLRGQGIL